MNEYLIRWLAGLYAEELNIPLDKINVAMFLAWIEKNSPTWSITPAGAVYDNVLASVNIAGRSVTATVLPSSRNQGTGDLDPSSAITVIGDG